MCNINDDIKAEADGFRLIRRELQRLGEGLITVWEYHAKIETIVEMVNKQNTITK